MKKHYQNSQLPAIPSSEGQMLELPLTQPQPVKKSAWPRRIFWLSFATVVMGSLATIGTIRLAKKIESQQFLAYTKAFAAGLNSPDLSALTGSPHDVGTVSYERVKNRLQMMRTANQRFRFLYFMGYRDGQWFFYLDSEPASSPDVSLPGDIYHEPTENHLWNWQVTEPFIYGPYHDEWGTWVSAFVPVTDEHGVKRFFGADINATAWTGTVFLVASIPISLTAILLVLLGFIYLLDVQHTRYLKKIYDEDSLIWRQHQRLDLAVKASRDGMFDIVINTGEAYYSDRFLEILGLRRSEKTVTPKFSLFLNLLHSEDRDQVIERLQTHFISGEPFLMDFRLKNSSSGEYVWVNGRGSAYFNEFDKPWRFAGFITDITEKKRLEHMRSEFISLASHQLRTPLTAIKWFSSILENGDVGKMSKEQRDCLKEIVVSNERMIQLVNDLLMVSRIERGVSLVPEKHPVILQDIVQEVIKNLEHQAKKQKVRIVYSSTARPVPLTIDRAKMTEAFLKIIKNALVYSEPSSLAHVNVSLGDDEVVITVVDQGIGILRKDQPHIFEKFFRSDEARLKEPEGNGLGLFIAKSYIEAHKGHVTFVSPWGKGTTFTISLPIV